MGILLKHILEHRSGRLSYRRAFPSDLRAFVPGGKREHKVSLGPKGAPGFLAAYQAAEEAYDRLVDLARRNREGIYDALDAPRIAYLAELYKSEELEADDEARWSTDERDLYRAVLEDMAQRGIPIRSRWEGIEERRWAEKSRETAEYMLDVYRELRGLGDLDGIVKIWREQAELLLEAQNLLIDPEAHEPFRRLCRALNDAAIVVCEAQLRRLDGEDVPTPPAPTFAPETLPKQAMQPPVPLLRLFEDYASAQGISAGVRAEWRRYLQRLVDFLGHDDASRITADRLRKWRDHLLSEVTARGQRAPVTVRDKYFTPLRATLAWAVEEKKLDANVALEVVVRLPKRTKLRDRDFTMSEARAILTATLDPCSPRLSPSYARARRWIPWLCAYTGARVNEMSQLRGQDIREIDGITVLVITPAAGTVKAREARTVPLHPHLIEQGFLKVVREVGDGPLFYEPSRQRTDKEANRHFKKVGERLAEWVREEVGISDPGLQPNHAWRHTFKSISYEHGIEERVIDAIQGHAPKTVGRTYGKPSVRALFQAIQRIPRFVVEP